ncbi:MAG: asparaginase [Chloroflexota bacterium]
MNLTPYRPIFELTRGGTVESIHDGAVAVVDAHGRLVAWYGDPQAVTFLRSSAKPFQALPFVEHGGPQALGLTQKELALICASHSGTDEHVATARSIQAKAGFSEADLMCGVHEPMDPLTAEALRRRQEPLTSNRHNCSGKHSGMLAYACWKRAHGQPLPDGLPYIDFAHPIQGEIKSAFAEMCGLTLEQVHMGIDGCSAPNFAVPLYNGALAFARLADPETGGVLPPARAGACHMIAEAMMAYPEMVGGPGRFDTRLMQVTRGRIVSKGGAEAYQGLGLLPGAIRPGSPALGIAMKISDGDDRNMALHAVAMEVLHQLGALSESEMQALSEFGPLSLRYNWRKIEVGRAYPTLTLSYS